MDFHYRVNASRHWDITSQGELDYYLGVYDNQRPNPSDPLKEFLTNSLPDLASCLAKDFLKRRASAQKVERELSVKVVNAEPEEDNSFYLGISGKPYMHMDSRPLSIAELDEFSSLVFQRLSNPKIIKNTKNFLINNLE